jgi:hypothetical protein
MNDLTIVVRQLRGPKLEGQLVELAGEAERHLVILIIHRSARITPTSKVSSIVMRAGMVCGTFLLATSLSSTFRPPGAPFADTGAVICEAKHDGVLARRKRLLAFQEVVGEHRLALQKIKPVSTEVATQGGEHAFGAALRNLHFGSNGIGLGDEVGRIAARETGHSTRRLKHSDRRWRSAAL